MAILNSYVSLPKGSNVGKTINNPPIWEWFVPPNTNGDPGDILWHCFTHIDEKSCDQPTTLNFIRNWAPTLEI